MRLHVSQLKADNARARELADPVYKGLQLGPGRRFRYPRRVTFPRTKIQPPRPRATYVARGALEGRVAGALRERRVVLACAPAGYGKTMLLAHALTQLPPGHAVAWVAADAGDDLQRLLECMLAALEPFDPPWRTAPEALVQRVAASAEDARAVAAELINALDAVEVERGVLVLDDLHRVEDPAFFRFLDVLLERMGARWTFVLASRTDPPVALARLRAAGDVEELRQLQLQFARDEARSLAAQAGLDEAFADRAFDRTLGWPAGMRMAIAAASQGKGARPERPLFEYLLEEVLDRLPTPLADFLLRVSVLPELEAARCAAVTGRADAAAMLEEMERLGLFVETLEAPARTLRLHDLFREALQHRLSVRNPSLLENMRRAAAHTEPDPLRRIPWLIEVGELAPAAALAFQVLPPLIVTSGPPGPLHVLGQFPQAFREASPELMMVRGLIGWVSWDFAAMHEHFARAEAGFAARGDADLADLARGYRATVLVTLGRPVEADAALATLRRRTLRSDARIVMLNAESWLAIDTGRLRSVAPIVDEMLDLLEKEARIDLWFHTSPPMRVPGLPGMARTLERHAALMLEAKGEEPTALRALGLLCQAWGAAWRGELLEAHHLRALTQQEAAWSGNSGAVRTHLLTHAALTLAMSDDCEAALEAAATRIRERTPGATPWIRYVHHWFGARVAAACGEAAVLRDMLRRMDAASAEMGPESASASHAMEMPVRAQLAWLEGRTDEAVAGWQRALQEEEAIDVYGQASETRVRLASAMVARGQLRKAAAILEGAFARALDDGGPGGALLAAFELRALAEAKWGDALAPEHHDRLRAWRDQLEHARLQRHQARRPQASGAAGLTARELEVLERIAAGDSNKLIARQLGLSPHTVKRHVANILDKLGVSTRGQAAARYREARE